MIEIPKPYLDAKKYIMNSSRESSIYVGCDSIKFRRKRKGIMHIRYSTAIVIHIDSCHGGKIFHHTVVEPEVKGDKATKLMSKLLKETEFAIDALEIIKHVVGDRNLELHLDLNDDPQHASHIAVKTAIGWATGMGYNTKIKPYSWCATHCADWAVRHVH